MHFIHVRPAKRPNQRVLPLMLVHGWPGSFYEFYRIIPFLTENPGGIVFEVICPSIPGYGFSEAPHKRGRFVSIELFFQLEINKDLILFLHQDLTVWQLRGSSWHWWSVWDSPSSTYRVETGARLSPPTWHKWSLSKSSTFATNAHCSESFVTH